LSHALNDIAAEIQWQLDFGAAALGMNALDEAGRPAAQYREPGGSTPDSAMRPRVRFSFALPAFGLLERVFALE
jgi:hypothetical protein